MTFQELIASRYSVRAYRDTPVKEEDLARVLEAARAAPTAHNEQPQRIKIIRGREDLAKVDECTPCRFGAGTVLLVCYDITACWQRSFDGAMSGEVDASIAVTHMTLAAHDAGLGSCWVMYFDPDKARDLFELPEDIVPVAFLPLGYPAEDAKPSPGHSRRKALGGLLL